jgi:Glycosyltransferases involved in cell wall biogenesis
MTTMNQEHATALRVAVILPCHCEELTIASTIDGFRQHLPHAEIVVCDNASTDQTAAVARAAGAKVIYEGHRGKGEAIRRLFAEVDADVYVMADGDATYDAAAAPQMIAMLLDGKLDMIVGSRRPVHGTAQYRPGHSFGNRLFSKIVQMFFNSPFDDLLSGYRVLSRRFVKTFPAEAKRFEIETELTIHVLEHRMPVAQCLTDYFPRPDGSLSKLSTFKDGFRILVTILQLLRDVKPLQFFSSIALLIAVFATLLTPPIIITFLETHTVPRLPTALVIVGMFILSFVFLTCGIILDRISASRRHSHRLSYLQHMPPGGSLGKR